MKIGTFQFACDHNIENNFISIERGIREAIQNRVELLLMPECALCGYFEEMIDDKGKYEIEKQDYYQEKLQHIIDRTSMTLVFGRIQSIGDDVCNVVAILRPNSDSSYYAKRALWGWDKNNFAAGKEKGFFVIGGVKIGTRICYEADFPEYFRELFAESIPIALVSFAHSGERDDIDRYEMMKGLLQTRAFENAMFVVSANSISGNQLTPTAIIDPNGRVIGIASRREEELLVFDYEEPPYQFGRQGRMEHSKYLCNMKQSQQ